MSVINDTLKVIETRQDQASKEVKASLDMLTTLSQAKLNEMANSTDDRIDNAIKNKEIPAGLKLFEASEMHVMSSKGPADGISKAVNLLISNASANWKTAVSSLINTAVNTLLGNATGASSNITYYIIAMDGQTKETMVPIRIDYCLWSYSFKSQGIVDIAQNAIAFHARKSLLDYSNVPQNTQIKQSLKSIGMSPDLIAELISEIEADKASAEGKENIRLNSLMLPRNYAAYHEEYNK